MTDDTEVLIIGAGPVGLSAAIALGRAGIRCMVLERRGGLSRHPKANGVHARTMEIFRGWETAEPVRALTAGMPAGVTIAWRTRLNGIEFGEISTDESEDAHRSFDAISPERLTTAGQHLFEPLLAKAAEELESVTLRLDAEVIEVTVNGDSVSAEYRDSSGGGGTVSAQYLIGADGVRSIVRRTLGIGEHSEASLGTAVNVQFDADLESYLDGRFIPLIWVVNKDTQGAFRRHSPTRWRYNFEVPPGIDPSTITPEQCKWEITQGIGEDVPIEIDNIWTWKHDLAVADKWRAGRVFLAGDAAHHFPPHGGFGLNTGVQDAHNLAWKLVAKLRWNAGEKLLDSYESERLPVADATGEQMMHNTREMEKTGFLTRDKDFLATVEADTPEGENARSSITEGVNAQQAQLANHGQQFGYQYTSTALVPDGTEIIESSVAEYRPNARPGARAPHSWVTLDGSAISTLDLYDGGFVLLTGPQNPWWADAARKVHEDLGIPMNSYALGRDLEPQDESLSELLARYGIERTGAVLIRPDGFVGFRAAERANDEYADLARAVSEILDFSHAR
jgi:putative polyketide hydroxylase